MTYLPDVNVWVALAVSSHIHHPAAVAWVGTCEQDTLVFCRVTEMGLLRLLTNERVMGEDVLRPKAAWAVRDGFFRDERVRFHDEPAGLESQWRGLTRGQRGGTNFWTDAYLSGFSKMAGVTLVSFDKGLRPFAGESLCLLKR